MKKNGLKYTSLAFLIICVSPFVYTTIYYFLEIRPHNESMSNKIKTYEGISKNRSLLEKMIVKVEGRKGIANYVSHSLAVDNIHNGFHKNWHIIGLHWHFWVRLKYSEEEIFRLWLAQVPYGSGRGMNEASTYHFKLPLEHLSCHQVSQLVVMAKAPTIYAPNTQRSELRIKALSLKNECIS